MAQTLQPTIKLVGKVGGVTKTVHLAAIKIEEDFSNPPLQLPIVQTVPGEEMTTKIYNLLKTKNTFTITGYIGYDIDYVVNQGDANQRNTFECYCDLRDISGATLLDNDSTSSGKAVTMTFYMAGPYQGDGSTESSGLKFKYPRDNGTDKEFTGHIMGVKIIHSPQDCIHTVNSIKYYSPDYVSGVKEANIIPVTVQILVGTPLG